MAPTQLPKWIVRHRVKETIVDTVEAHVLARAYHAAWRALRGADPAGRHVLARLSLVIDFGRVKPPS